MSGASDALRRARLAASVTAVVIVTDQATKWWAWRHVSGALVNPGGFILLSQPVRSWFAGPVGSVVANVTGLVLIAGAAAWLVAAPTHRAVLVCGSAVAAGWLSNILDRLALHRWTAPGAGAGVVDFVPQPGPGRFNLADVWIVAGAVGCAAAALRRTGVAAAARTAGRAVLARRTSRAAGAWASRVGRASGRRGRARSRE